MILYKTKYKKYNLKNHEIITNVNLHQNIRIYVKTTDSYKNIILK